MITYIRSTWWGRILADCHTEPTELLLGGFLKWLVGTWLSLPLNSFKASPTFSTIGLVLPEMLWAVSLMTLGAAHMIILRQGNRTWRAVASFIGCVIWFAMTCTFIYTNPPAFGAMLFLTASICQGWCYIRLRGSR